MTRNHKVGTAQQNNHSKSLLLPDGGNVNTQ